MHKRLHEVHLETEVLGQTVQPSCFHICLQNRKSIYSPSLPHNVLNEILYLSTLPMITLTCIVITYMAKKYTAGKNPRTPTAVYSVVSLRHVSTRKSKLGQSWKHYSLMLYVSSSAPCQNSNSGFLLNRKRSLITAEGEKTY